jgi:hypothetical protein
MPEQGTAPPFEVVHDVEQIADVSPEIVGSIDGALPAPSMAGEVERHDLAIRKERRQQIEAPGVVQPAVQGYDGASIGPSPDTGREREAWKTEFALDRHGLSA